MVLVTGAAGFIGMHLCQALLESGEEVVGIDNLNDYYDPRLKLHRLERLRSFQAFQFLRMDLLEKEMLLDLFRTFRFHKVFHLAAQAGVRYSMENPDAYIQTNIIGFTNILECCRAVPPSHLLYASSSSVYGLNRIPFDVEDGVDHPVSLYAATKKANELLAHSYSHLYGIPTSGLRFFTVYGPRGRPDMAPWLFADAICGGRAIKLFNEGNMRRDFSYVGDVVNGILAVAENSPLPNPEWDPVEGRRSGSSAPWRIVNLGNNKPIELRRFVEILEQALGLRATIELAPMQSGDVVETYANIDPLREDFGYIPSTSLEEGLPRFAAWFREWKGL